MKKHWYRLYLGACPICGKDQGFREHVYGERPVQREDRITYLSDTRTYDNCLGF